MEDLIEYGVTRSVNSKITLRRSTTASTPSSMLDIDTNKLVSRRLEQKLPIFPKAKIIFRVLDQNALKL